MSSAPLVRVEGLTATAGSVVLVDGVSFEVVTGEVTALVGASGSGKTTSALALLGEHGAGVRLKGRVEVDGQLVVDSNGVTQVDVRGRVVAYLPQHPGSALNPARRIRATLRELAQLHDGDPDAAVRAAQLPSDRRILQRFPHQFSGGQRQRVALAQTLTCRPKVLILDEPTTGLDSITRRQLVHELRSLAGTGLGILLLSHDLDLVDALATRTITLGRPAKRADFPDPGTTCIGEPLLEAMNLSASLRREIVLRDVDVIVRAGSCLGMVGRSGSGKTTLARCLAGLHERHTGTIRLGGKPLPVLRQRTLEQHRRVQYVWQEVRGSFDERRPVAQQVARTAERLRGLAPDRARAEAVSTLDRLGVAASTAARPPSRLSGGELQRAALARAVLAHPDVLICDEITTALDDRGTALVLDLLAELRAGGTALLWIGHDLRLVASVADEIVVLDSGRVVEHGPPEALLTTPRHALTRRLVDAARIGATEPPPVLIPDTTSDITPDTRAGTRPDVKTDRRSEPRR